MHNLNYVVSAWFHYDIRKYVAVVVLGCIVDDRLSHKHGTVFLPTSLHQLLYRLSRDNLKHFYLPNLSHHFKLLSHICVPCPKSYLAYATLISTFYYYYYYCLPVHAPNDEVPSCHWSQSTQWSQPSAQSPKFLVANICDLPDVINCRFHMFAAPLLGPVHFLLPDRHSGIHCLITCGIQLSTLNNWGGTWRHICLLDIRSVSTLEVFTLNIRGVSTLEVFTHIRCSRTLEVLAH